MSSNLVLNQDQKQMLNNAVKEVVNSKYRVQGERDLMKEIAAKVKDELQLPPKQFNKLCTTAYDNAFNKLNAETTEVLDLAEELKLYTHSEV